MMKGGHFQKEFILEEEDEKMNTSTLSNNSSGKTTNKFKTELCKFWEMNKTCKYKDNCVFAHGAHELREKQVAKSNYKTKKCKQFFESAYCSYGTRCQFRHQDDLPTTHFSYSKLISELIDPNNFSNDTEIAERPRLKIFEKLSKAKADCKKEGLLKELLKMKNNANLTKF